MRSRTRNSNLKGFSTLWSSFGAMKENGADWIIVLVLQVVLGPGRGEYNNDSFRENIACINKLVPKYHRQRVLSQLNLDTGVHHPHRLLERKISEDTVSGTSTN